MQAILADMESEAGFQNWLVGYATLFGWRCWHDNDSRRNDPGLPDQLMVRGHRLIFAELKRQRGRLRREQREWLDALAGVGGTVEVYVWRPSDRPTIEATLR